MPEVFFSGDSEKMKKARYRSEVSGNELLAYFIVTVNVRAERFERSQLSPIFAQTAIS